MSKDAGLLRIRRMSRTIDQLTRAVIGGKML
jgi:hypothetical protein